MTPADPLARLVAAVLDATIHVTMIRGIGARAMIAKEWNEIERLALAAAQAARPVEGAACDGTRNAAENWKREALRCADVAAKYIEQREQMLKRLQEHGPHCIAATPTDAPMRPEYDVTGGERGKYHAAYVQPVPTTGNPATDADVEAVARAIYEASPAANSWGERIEWTEAVEMRLYHVVPVRKQARAALAALRARRAGAP